MKSLAARLLSSFKHVIERRASRCNRGLFGGAAFEIGGEALNAGANFVDRLF